jgi:HEAT repeat protein
MPRETIRRTMRDVERVLVAGAHLAAADPNLAADRKALDGFAAQLGAKAPALVQLAAAATRATTTAGPDAVREVVGLAAMCAQVRRAQAQAAPVAPERTPLPARPAIGTPCNAKELLELHGALVEHAKGRQERIEAAIDSGAIADLRLVDALIHAMGDPYIGTLVSTRAIPLLGAAAAVPIRAALNIRKARAIDARRLQALVISEQAGARDLLALALKEGNAALRETAFDAIADHVRGEPEFEAIALEALAHERGASVRRAALRALAGYASDASLKVLQEAIDDPRTHAAAAEALGRSKHPGAVEWMLARLGAGEAPKQAKKKKKDAADADEKAEVVPPATMAQSLLQALARQDDPRIATAAMALLGTCGAPAAEAVVRNGTLAQKAVVADLLHGEDPSCFPAAAAACVALGAEEAWKRFTAAFPAKGAKAKRVRERLEAVVAHLDHQADPRWCAFLMLQLDGDQAVAVQAVHGLGRLKNGRAVAPLLALLSPDQRRHEQSMAAIDALGVLGDPAAIDALLAFQSADYRTQWHIHRALIRLAEPGTVDKVRRLVVAQGGNQGQAYYLMRGLLHQLEQRFPGN